MDAESETWSSDWSSRLHRELRAKGYGSFVEFLDAHPCESYLTVGDKIAPWVAGMQLQRAQLEEAMRTGRMQHAVADALAREFCEVFPQGWHGDERGISALAAALGRWVGMLVANAGLQDAHSAAIALSTQFREEPPPNGWSPTGASDSVLLSLLTRCWPGVFHRGRS
jgi:hypothetical protein